MNRELEQEAWRVAEEIDEWIDSNMTYANGCKRDPEEGDCFDEGVVAWVFTQKGQRLTEEKIKKETEKLEEKYPGEIIPDIESMTSIIYP